MCGNCVSETSTDFMDLFKKEVNNCCQGVFCARENKCFATAAEAPKDCNGVACGDAIEECGRCITGSIEDKRQVLEGRKLENSDVNFVILKISPTRCHTLLPIFELI